MPVLRLQGYVRSAEAVTLNDAIISLKAERFNETIRLTPGKNRIELSAIDQAGNEAIASWSVQYPI